MKDRNTEIREAIDAGNRAMDALDEALGHLKTAHGLGIWDMLGGGFFSSFLKHSKMDDAQRAMQYAQQELQNFSRELADVQMALDFQVNFDGMTRFFDMFCDNFFCEPARRRGDDPSPDLPCKTVLYSLLKAQGESVRSLPVLLCLSLRRRGSCTCHEW